MPVLLVSVFRATSQHNFLVLALGDWEELGRADLGGWPRRYCVGQLSTAVTST